MTEPNSDALASMLSLIAEVEPSPTNVLALFAKAFENSYVGRKQRVIEERDRLLRVNAFPKMPGEDGWDHTLRVEREAEKMPHIDVTMDQMVRLAVLIFARPTAKLSKEVIDPNSLYLDVRSGKHIDIVRIGYRDDGQFYESDFATLLAEFERSTKWRYSGDSDVLLFNIRYDSKSSTVEPDFSRVVSITLEKALRDGAFESANAFFEDLIRFTASFQGTDPAWGFSDSMAAKEGGHVLVQLVLKLLPQEIKTSFDRLKHLAVRDVSVQS